MAQVTLRPFRPDDLARSDAEFSTEEAVGPFQWFGFSAAGAETRAHELATTGFLGDGGGRLIAEVDGEWAGEVEWRRHSTWGPSASWCWQIGILIRREMRGRGVGSEAQRLLAAYLFAHTRAHRVEAVTDIENTAEQRALEKAGFTREGVVRQCQWRGGRWHDQVLYSRLRDRPEDPVPR